MINDRYGTLGSVEDAAALSMDEQEEQQPYIDTVGNSLWDYQHEGRINGVPVFEGDRDLKIDRDDMLAAAFTLYRTPRSLLLYLAPGDDDKGNAKYSELLLAAADGSVEIIDELRQWDAGSNRFVLWVRYDELEYRLHPRFAFLREE